MRFSVVIPSYDRPERLRSALEALATLAYPVDAFEVLVVDDGGNDDTAAAVAEAPSPLLARYLRQPERRGPASARNLGAAHARGEFLAFLDDDCVPDTSWLAALDRAIATTGDRPVAFGGRTLTARANTIYGSASQSLVDFLYTWYNRDPRDATFFATNNFACARRHFEAIGGFDPSFRWAAAEDRDFCERWRERGWRMAYVDDAVVHHSQRTTLQEFVRQQSGYGRGAVDLHEARDRRGLDRPRLEPLRFYWGLMTHALGREPLPRALAHVALAALSQGAYAWGYYGERLRRRWSGAHRSTVTAPSVAPPSPGR